MRLVHFVAGFTAVLGGLNYLPATTLIYLIYLLYSKNYSMKLLLLGGLAGIITKLLTS